MLESTSVLLKRLENKDLALEPTQKVPAVRENKPTPKASKARAGESAEPAEPQAAERHPALQRDRRRDGGGFDPYNSSR